MPQAGGVEDQEPLFEGIVGDIVGVMAGLGVTALGPLIWYFSGNIVGAAIVTVFGLVFTILAGYVLLVHVGWCDGKYVMRT